LDIWRSLRTDSLKVALRRLPIAAARVEMEIEHARAVAGMPVDPTLIPSLADDLAERPQVIPTSATFIEAGANASVTLGEAYRRYIDDPTRSWSPSTREAYETSRKLAIAVIGEEVPIASLARTHCRDLLNVLRFLPRNAGKLFPKMSPREASDRARLRGDIKIISAANANSLISNMSSFLNWAVNEELLSRNPARGLRLADMVAKRDKRLPFSPAQLQTIFDSPLFRGCVDGGRGYSKIGDERPRNARFWVPLIGLHTGARLGEICQLDVADIRVVDGIL